jgi:hypothetical protein
MSHPPAFGVATISPSRARQSACPIGRHPARLDPVKVASGRKFFEAADGKAATRSTIPTAITLARDIWGSAFQGSRVQGVRGVQEFRVQEFRVQEFAGSGLVLNSNFLELSKPRTDEPSNLGTLELL